MSLIQTIEILKKDDISKIIQNRIKEFSSIKKGGIAKIFKELCFCIMTANCGAAKCIEVNDRIDEGFLNLPEEELVNKFKEFGYRFPNIRAKYIIEARNYISELESIINSNINEMKLREWVVKNVKGIGYKEASHFLRNIGYKNLAIIDFHIVDLLVKYDLIQKPKSMTKKKYLEIENVLKQIGREVSLDMAKLDLYLWYKETGKVLK
jgi:N-glycosylase/DNA lyase